MVSFLERVFWTWQVLKCFCSKRCCITCNGFSKTICCSAFWIGKICWFSTWKTIFSKNRTWKMWMCIESSALVVETHGIVSFGDLQTPKFHMLRFHARGQARETFLACAQLYRLPYMSIKSVCFRNICMMVALLFTTLLANAGVNTHLFLSVHVVLFAMNFACLLPFLCYGVPLPA